MRNVEIKARVDNPEEFLAKVKKISDSEEIVIPQKDIFFNLPADRPGRLKLRKYKVSLHLELILFFFSQFRII